MNDKQLELLNEIKVKMFYDPTKTLSEQETRFTKDLDQNFSNPTPLSPKIEHPLGKDWEDTEIYPIPGFTTYIIPKINDPNGGVAYYYFPLETTKIQKFTFPVCQDFKNGEKFCETYSVSQPELSKILPTGSIREFRIGENYYTARIGYNLTKNQLVFAGYTNQNGELYKSPNPEDFKSQWEKFLDDYGTTFQIIGSLLVILVAEFFTAGMATPIAWRLGIEILGELIVNLPIALYDYKRGDTMGGNLSLLFALLPFMDVKNIKGLTKEIASGISEELLKWEIRNVEDLGKFYESLTKDQQYVFYQVMKQNPEFFKQQYKEGITKLFNQAVNNKEIIQKLLLKDQTWWKNLGIQGGAVFFIMTMKSIFSKDFSEQEKERMTKYYFDLSKQLKTDEKRWLFQQYLLMDEQFSEEVYFFSLLPEGSQREESFRVIESFLDISGKKKTMDRDSTIVPQDTTL